MSVHVKRTKSGRLALRIFYAGRDERIGTRLAATEANERSLRAKACLIDEALGNGKPLHEAILRALGDVPARLLPFDERSRRETTLREYYDGWIARQVPPVVRPSYRRNVKIRFEAQILPALGDKTFAEIDRAVLEAFRAELLSGTTTRKTPRSIKTVRNVIGWCLRALWRDAEAEGFAGEMPSLRWPRIERPLPEPFTADERDRIIGWFGEHETWMRPWIECLFWTGLRHGEAAALRWRDVDLTEGTVFVRASRSERVDGTPKTRGSVRTIPLLPEALSAIRARLGTRPLHSVGDEYVFATPEGSAMTDVWWPKRGRSERRGARDPKLGVWFRCLRALAIRPRKAYCTRHTSISAQLSAGVPAQVVAEYHGTSLVMIQQSYGRYMRNDVRAVLMAAMTTKTEARSAGTGSTGPEIRPEPAAGRITIPLRVRPVREMEAVGIERPAGGLKLLTFQGNAHAKPSKP